MDSIDIYNDSSIIFQKNTPKSISSWITILITLLILFIIISFIPFNIYFKCNGYVNIDKDNTFLILELDKKNFPITTNYILYIGKNKYNYKVTEIMDDKVVLELNLKDDIKINNNFLTVNILKKTTTLNRIIIEKIKKGFGL